MIYRYFIELSYNGKPFHGWQIQDNAITVQEVLNKALTTILRENINVVGAGRTDTGVHASFFMAHFELENQISDIPLAVNKLNKFLPKDIAVYNIRRVNNEAHTRFDAISRISSVHFGTVKSTITSTFLKVFSVFKSILIPDIFLLMGLFSVSTVNLKYLLDLEDLIS